MLSNLQLGMSDNRSKRRRRHENCEQNDDNVVFTGSGRGAESEYYAVPNNMLIDVVTEHQRLPPEQPIHRRSLKKAKDDANRLIGVHTPECVDYYVDDTDGSENARKRIDHRRKCIVCKQLCGIICKACNLGLCIRNTKGLNCWELYNSKDL